MMTAAELAAIAGLLKLTPRDLVKPKPLEWWYVPHSKEWKARGVGGEMYTVRDSLYSSVGSSLFPRASWKDAQDLADAKAWCYNDYEQTIYSLLDVKP
jgi:hypothetical protein